MTLNIAYYNASLTISCTLRKLVEGFKASLLLAMPKKNSLSFLSGLAQLILNSISQVLSIIRRVTEPTVSTILTIIDSTIVKTGPPVIVPQR